MKNKLKIGKSIKIYITLLYLFVCTGIIYSQEYEVNFDEQYIIKNNNKVTVEINPVQELVYIIIANTSFAEENPMLVKNDTEYYQQMKFHFSKYSNSPIVEKFDSLLRENILNFFILAGNAYGYEFKKNKIIPTGIYVFPAKGVANYQVENNPINLYLQELQDFALESGFENFYEKNNKYYTQIIEDYHAYAEIDKQKSWLEDRFDYKINSFKVLTSPLIAGMNATQTFENNGFKETLLFIPMIRKSADESKALNTAINTRVIFTEIDHNYVGEVSEIYVDEIDKIFNKRSTWVNSDKKGVKYYASPLKVFDEYMTWALFLIYAKDNYTEQVYLEIKNRVIEQMIERGFPKFEAFSIELLRLYEIHSPLYINEIYPTLLDWCSQQQ